MPNWNANGDDQHQHRLNGTHENGQADAKPVPNGMPPGYQQQQQQQPPPPQQPPSAQQQQGSYANSYDQSPQQHRPASNGHVGYANANYEPGTAPGQSPAPPPLRPPSQLSADYNRVSPARAKSVDTVASVQPINGSPAAAGGDTTAANNTEHHSQQNFLSNSTTSMHTFTNTEPSNIEATSSQPTNIQSLLYQSQSLLYQYEYDYDYEYQYL